MIENTEELQGQLIASGNVVASMISQKGAKGDKGDKGDTGTPGTDGTDGFSPIITTEKQGKVTTLTIVDAEGTKTATILDGNDGSGTGDMLKATYDQNNNGIVDNAEKVNNHTVAVDVPADAVFTDTTYTAGTNVSISAGNVISATDTTYTAGTGIEITAGNVINNTQTSAEWGNISGTLADQTDLKNALDSKGTYSKPSGGIPKTDLASAVQTSLGKADTAIQSSDLATVATTGDYDDLIDKPTIPSKVSDLTNDSGFITGLVELSYGSSTWNDFITAYNAKKIVYCRASSNADPSSGSQTRKAFMAYVNNVDSPTSVEFQYVRSIATHTDSQQGDQVFVYTLTSANGGTWSVSTREMSTKVVAGTNMTSSYSNGVLTLNAEAESIPVQDTAPASPEENDLWIDTSEPEEMQEAIVNEYSESINETYSCDYSNKSNTYSTTEIKTGKIWIDGKPIYSRVVNVGTLPNNTSLNVPTSTFDGANKFITQMYGIGASSQEEYLKIPYYATDQNYINLIINSTHQISISTGADRSRFTGYIYLEYTKTTD